MLTKHDKPYLDVELSDKSGNVKAKIWNDALDKYEDSTEGDIVEVTATVENYNDNLQLRISSLKKTNEYNLSDYQAVSARDIESMVEQVNQAIESTKNKFLQKLLKNVFTKDFLKDFSESSASYRIHHAYKAGLIEHVTEMLVMADSILVRYPKMNSDLLRAGILLHDIGKIKEYQTNTSITISTQGKLLGHIFMGAEYVKAQAPKDMPELLLDEILHLVLSHHGQLEYGSPILPKTPEAITLAALDNSSAKINSSYMAIHETDSDDEFTVYYRHLGTELYRSPYMDSLTNEDVPF
ncbi:MAG: HD domain-containing protein [bacterium]